MKLSKLTLIFALAAVMVAVPAQAFAQDPPTPAAGGQGANPTDPSQQIVPSLELEQSDIRDALKALFKSVNIPYVIASDVVGQITISLKNVPFETALNTILKQVDATYKIDAGIYTIIKRVDNPAVTNLPQDNGPLPTARREPVRIKIMHADVALIFALLQGQFNPNMPSELSHGSGAGVGGGGFGGGGGGGFGGGAGGIGGGAGGAGGFGGGGGGGFGGGGGAAGGGGGGGGRSG